MRNKLTDMVARSWYKHPCAALSRSFIKAPWLSAISRISAKIKLLSLLVSAAVYAAVWKVVCMRKFLEKQRVQFMRIACIPRFLMGITLMYFLSINTVNITYLL